MFWFLLFYIIFSELFMFGYVDFEELAAMDWWVAMISVILAVILAPILFPINFGTSVRGK